MPVMKQYSGNWSQHQDTISSVQRGAQLQDIILEYPEVIPGFVIRISRNYTSYRLSAGINPCQSHISAGIAYSLVFVLYKI